ncbi:non-specific lipid-transfer protein-like, partial [Asparagus officinalis]|uniref:non-specific lipid-transfer protein-like n=1 Tax=Asparagus officinalis TaxID=4686 RepID=UPI00098E84EE
QHAEAVTCSGVASALAPCVNYVRGIGPLQAGCCNGVKTLSSAAMTGPARQATCNCLKSFAAKIPGIKYGLAAGVPAMCNVNVGYAISPSTDCSKVH